MKTMKLFVLLLTVSLLVSCSKNDDDGDGSNITVPNQSELTQTAYADQETTGEGFTFTAKSEWTATLNEVAVTKSADTSPLSWVKLLNNGTETYSGLAGTFKLAIELEPNYSGTARSAKIVIQSGNDKITIIVEQDGLTVEDKVPVDPYPVTGLAITSNTPNGNVEVGDMIQLKATVSPAQAKIKSVLWTSDKPEIATVNPTTGLVTATGKGIAIITARSTIYPTIINMYQITVREKTSGTATGSGTFIDNTRTASLSVNTVTQKFANRTVTVNLTNTNNTGFIELYFTNQNVTDVSLVPGSFIYSGATGTGAKTFTGVSYISGHKVTMYGGTVTVSMVGKDYKIELDATARDVDNNPCTIKGSYIGRIDDAVVAGETLTLNKTSLTLELGQNERLQATLSSANADSKVTWSEGLLGVSSTGVGAVINVHSGYITPMNPGTATVTATSTYGGRANCVVTVNQPENTGSGEFGYNVSGGSTLFIANYVIQQGSGGNFEVRMHNLSNFSSGNNIRLFLSSGRATETVLSAGTYPYGSDVPSGRTFTGIYTSNGNSTDFKSGTVTVTLSGDTYSIQIDATAAGSGIVGELSGWYSGKMKKFD